MNVLRLVILFIGLISSGFVFADGTVSQDVSCSVGRSGTSSGTVYALGGGATGCATAAGAAMVPLWNAVWCTTAKFNVGSESCASSIVLGTATGGNIALTETGTGEVGSGCPSGCSMIASGPNSSWANGTYSSVCPANSTGTTTCTCNTGYTPDPSSAYLCDASSNNASADIQCFHGVDSLGNSSGDVVCTSDGVCTGGGQTYSTPAAACASYNNVVYANAHIVATLISSSVCERVLTYDAGGTGTPYFGSLQNTCLPGGSGGGGTTGLSGVASAVKASNQTAQTDAMCMNTCTAGGGTVAACTTLCTAPSNQGGGPSTSLTLPTDYARTGEAGIAANSINATLGAKLDTANSALSGIASGVGATTGFLQNIECWFDPTCSSPGMPVYSDPAVASGVPTSSTITSDFQGVANSISDEGTDETLEDSISSWFTFSLPTPACTAWSGTIAGQAWAYDWCPYAEDIRAGLGWLCAVLGAMTIFNTMTRSGA